MRGQTLPGAKMPVHLAWNSAVILKLHDLPELTAGWIASAKDDPDLYAELAETLVVGPSREAPSANLPGDVRDVLAVVDLADKEIGAFHFAPSAGRTAAERIERYDSAVRETLEADADLLFLGNFGESSVFHSQHGVGLLDLTFEPARIIPLAPTFADFLLVQANAYDAYKRYMVEASDVAGYRAAAAACAANATFARVDVPAIFERQLKG